MFLKAKTMFQVFGSREVTKVTGVVESLETQATLTLNYTLELTTTTTTTTTTTKTTTTTGKFLSSASKSLFVNKICPYNRVNCLFTNV